MTPQESAPERKVRAVENGIVETCAGDDRRGETGAGKNGVREIGARKVRPVEIGVGEFGAHGNHALIGRIGAEIRADQLRMAKVDAFSAADDARIREVGIGKTGAVEKSRRKASRPSSERPRGRRSANRRA